MSALYLKATVDSIPPLASSPACNGFFRFISGATPADLLVASMAAKPFHPHTCIQALVGLESRIQHAAASQYVTRQTLYRLGYAGSAHNVKLAVNIDVNIDVDAKCEQTFKCYAYFRLKLSFQLDV